MVKISFILRIPFVDTIYIYIYISSLFDQSEKKYYLQNQVKY